MEDTNKTIPLDMERIGFDFKGSDLKVPVYSIFDGRNMQSDAGIGLPLFREMLIKTLHWDKAVKPFVTTANVTGIDFGPSIVSQKLTQANMGTSENKIYAVSSPKDIKVLLA